MSIIQANTNHLPQIRQLLHKGRHVFSSFGEEDLPTFLEKQLALLAEERGAPWGFLCIEIEERPITLPATAPDRVYLRALALAQGRSPAHDAPALMNAAIHQLQNRRHPIQIIVYGAESWLTKPLLTAGFNLTERVQFFQLDLHRYTRVAFIHSAPPQLQSMQPADIPNVAELDALAFDPLWHFSAEALWELMFRCRMEVALVDEKIVGYSALSARGEEAQLARLAVHPAVQGQGIGRLLLFDNIAYAQANQFALLSLNTQLSNESAQKLYRQVGFRPTGVLIPVLTQTILS